MSEFQSNRPFPTSIPRIRPPLVRYSYPPILPTMSPQKSRTLWCLVEGDPMPYYVFDIPIGANVDRLKALIHERAIKLLHDTDARHLRLLKVISLIPRERIF